MANVRNKVTEKRRMRVESVLRSENILQRHVERRFTVTGTLSLRRVSSREEAGSGSHRAAPRHPCRSIFSRLKNIVN